MKATTVTGVLCLLFMGCGGSNDGEGTATRWDDGDTLDQERNSNDFDDGQRNIEDAFDQGRQSTQDAFNRGLQGARDAYVQGGGKRTVSKAEMEKLYEALVFKVKPGMSASHLRSVLGEPSDIEDFDVNGKQFSIWKWDGEPAIQLGVESGVVVRGGTPGYDIRTGFKTKLPPNLKGDAKLREALNRLGVQTEN